MKRVLTALAATLPFAANAADALTGAVERQPTNWQAIIMFLIFVLLTLYITYWASKRVRSRNDYYTAGGNITGFQNGLAIAGDFMSAASFLGISALVYTSGYDGLIYSLGFLVGWPIILFLIAIKMIFPSAEGSSSGLPAGEEPFIVPLAIPLVAGPTILATLMLLSHQYPNQMSHLVIALLIAWGGTFIILLQSSLFLRLLGEKGVNALERLMGLILVMMATQMFLDGIRAWMKG